MTPLIILSSHSQGNSDSDLIIKKIFPCDCKCKGEEIVLVCVFRESFFNFCVMNPSETSVSDDATCRSTLKEGRLSVMQRKNITTGISISESHFQINK